MFKGSKSVSLRDVSVTRIGDTLSYGFSQTDLFSICYFLTHGSSCYQEMQKLLQCTVALVNQTALWALMFLFQENWHITCRHGSGLLFQFLLFAMHVWHRQQVGCVYFLISTTSSHGESLAATIV